MENKTNQSTTPMQLNIDSKIKLSNNQVASQIDDDLLVLDMKSGDYFKIQETGVVIWKLLEDETTVTDIVDHLMQEYAISQEQCIDETMKFLTDLMNIGYIEITG
jgi:hypothetical protein